MTQQTIFLYSKKENSFAKRLIKTQKTASFLLSFASLLFSFEKINHELSKKIHHELCSCFHSVDNFETKLQHVLKTCIYFYFFVLCSFVSLFGLFFSFFN